MKGKLIKKVFAVSLSIAMACSLLPASNPVTASAKAPFVTLKTTFKTLKVGQKYKMTLKNNTINWKIKKVETTDKTIATVYGKTSSQVMLKGKSEGRATIRVRVKTTTRKANNTKTLRCRVKVVAAAPSVDPTTPVQTDATVETQEQLDDALNNSSITKITIAPKAAVNFEIKQGSYSNVDLIVNAPLSDIVNSATFKSITINNIKADTWTERGTGNTFSVLAKAARIIVDRAAVVRGITIGAADSKINLEVNGGTVSAVNVAAKSELNIKGTAAQGAALIPVTFSAAAANSVFLTELPVAVYMSASIELTFEKGAVKSTVKLEVAGIKATITNNTDEAIVVTKNDNTTQTVAKGAQKSAVNATTTTPVNPGTSTGGSTGGSTVSKPATTQRINTGMAVWASISGSALGVDTVSSSSLTFQITHVTATPSALQTVEYSLVASAKNWTKTISSGDLVYDQFKDKDGLLHDSQAITIRNASLNGAPIGEEITITVTCRVKETSTTAASVSSKVSGKIKINKNEDPKALIPETWFIEGWDNVRVDNDYSFY